MVKGKGTHHGGYVAGPDERYVGSTGSGGSTPIDSDTESSCCSDSDEEYQRVRSNIRNQGISVRR